MLKTGKRIFLFAKFLFTSLAYSFGPADSAIAGTIAFIKGKNQLRHHNNVAERLNVEFGQIQLFSTTQIDDRCKAIGRMSIGDLSQQLLYLTMLLLTGRRRYLNLYFLAFSLAIEKVVLSSFCRVHTFVCYNDQPYDVAAILYALNSRMNCRTIVIQHGLVLSERFYFPTNAHEFWAWGELSEGYFYSRHSAGKFLIKGRFSDDLLKRGCYSLAQDGALKKRIIVAPSFFHKEIKGLMLRIAHEKAHELKGVSIGIKLHPATKFKFLLRLWFVVHAPWLKLETENMELLSERYDAIITKNSTSAVDFLLRGKAVFFDQPDHGRPYPSLEYAFELGQLKGVISDLAGAVNEKKYAREKFLRSALNV
jgi:hypothetical protein